MTHLVARIVKLRPIVLTMLTTDSFYERVKTEMARSFDANETEYAERVRLVKQSTFVRDNTLTWIQGSFQLERLDSSDPTRPTVSSRKPGAR